MKKLLLHICCGPCATHVLDILGRDYEVTGYFCNPNIHPEEEYLKRLDAACAVAEKQGVSLIEREYNPQTFFDAVRGYEDEPENGERCRICYRVRFSETARYAAYNSFDCIASTLTLGPQKKASVINPIGKEEAENTGLSFIEGDWKKKDGFKRSCELSREYGIYRQDYCGCLFSMNTKSKKILGNFR